MISALPPEHGLGRTFDGVGRAQPDARGARRLGWMRVEHRTQHNIVPHIGRRVAFKDDGLPTRNVFLIGKPPHLPQPLVAFLIRQPHDLERAVALERAAVVVVNGLAGPREQTRRGIVLVHDEVRVGLVALQCHTHDHLPDGGARQRVSAAQRLRTQQHMNAKRAALAHDAIQQQRRALRNAVVFHE